MSRAVVWVLFSFALIGIAYLLGSIPTGYLAGRLLKGIDIREHGSGSTGATNVLRTLGKPAAVVVFTIDVLKGVLAIALAQWSPAIAPALALDPATSPFDWTTTLPWIITFAGLAALLGHSRSIWLNFTGGKSVATGLGVVCTMAWPVGLGALLTFALVLGIWRIVSLGSVCAAIAVMVLMLLTQQPLPYQLLAIAGGLFVIWRHQSNIQRLFQGTEPKIGQKLTTPSGSEETLSH